MCDQENNLRGGSGGSSAREDRRCFLVRVFNDGFNGLKARFFECYEGIFYHVARGAAAAAGGHC